MSQLNTKEIVNCGLVHYALATGFEAGTLTEKQSQLFNWYQHGALAMMMAIRSGDIKENQRYSILNAYFDRTFGQYGKWADDVIKTVRDRKNDGQRIRSFDSYYIASMREPYAEFCRGCPDTLLRIEKSLNKLQQEYLNKREIIKGMQLAGAQFETKPKLAIFN